MVACSCAKTSANLGELSPPGAGIHPGGSAESKSKRATSERPGRHDMTARSRFCGAGQSPCCGPRQCAVRGVVGICRTRHATGGEPDGADRGAVPERREGLTAVGYDHTRNSDPPKPGVRDTAAALDTFSGAQRRGSRCHIAASRFDIPPARLAVTCTRGTSAACPTPRQEALNSPPPFRICLHSRCSAPPAGRPYSQGDDRPRIPFHLVKMRSTRFQQGVPVPHAGEPPGVD